MAFFFNACHFVIQIKNFEFNKELKKIFKIKKENELYLQ